MRHPRFYEFTLTSNEADLDLFVRRDGPPTLTLFDFYSNDTEQNRTIRVPFPAFGPQQNSKWYAGVYRVQGDTVLYFTLEAKAVFCEECISGNGVCTTLNDSYPFCQCQASYAGHGCEIGVTTIGLQSRQSFNIAPLAFNYHQFKVPTGLSPYGAVLNLFVTVNSGGPLEFFVRHRNLPTTYDFNFRSGLSNFTFTIARPNLVDGDAWYVASMSLGNSAIYTTYMVVEEERPPPSSSTSSVATTTFSTSTTKSATTGGGSTTGSNSVVVPVVMYNGGAMAGLAIGMLIAGGLIGVGGVWFLRRRGYSPLSQL